MTNRDAHGRKGALVAAIRGTKAETVIAVLEKIQLAKRKTVSEITLDLSSSMMLIARRSFPKVTVTNDRFHVQKLYYDAIDELRISLRWMVCDIENEEIARCRKYRVAYVTFRYPTATPVNSCLPERNISLPGMPRSGHAHSSGELTSSSSSTRS